jgi:hypothetical protein
LAGADTPGDVGSGDIGDELPHVFGKNRGRKYESSSHY